MRRISMNSWMLAAIPSAQMIIQMRRNFIISAGVSAGLIAATRKYHSETIGKNWGAKAKEMEQQSKMIRTLLKTYKKD